MNYIFLVLIILHNHTYRFVLLGITSRYITLIYGRYILLDIFNNHMVDMCLEGIWACAYLNVMCISKEDEATIRDTCGRTMSLIIIITENNSAFLWKEITIMMKVRLDCVLRH